MLQEERTIYRFSFDLPTSVNKMYMRKHNSVVLTNEARNWKQYAMLMARQQFELDKPLKGRIAVTIHFYQSNLDIDNGIKALFDAMNTVIWVDDKQIEEMHVYMTRQADEKHVDLEVWQLY